MNSTLFQYVITRFDNLRIPRENLLNSVADVSQDGQYLSTIKDPDQVVITFPMADICCMGHKTLSLSGPEEVEHPYIQNI